MTNNDNTKEKDKTNQNAILKKDITTPKRENNQTGTCEIDWITSSGKIVNQQGDISFNRLKEYVLNTDSKLLRVSFMSKEAAKDINNDES